ncbi:type IX secretion system protein PorQ [Flavobacterium amnicola]|uniref:Type IX secretion system protein PorQ n=1 Tax=Flavobacterium amnicola TaxID=2506422 RepID=A0A4Q1K1F9_9FLAO|nr:type IX secretion system protein PorQ [Flavobacterium amnicola]RXR17264.1 type IX secretion system protein PorQ [Flavobacterium amnicola]
MHKKLTFLLLFSTVITAYSQIGGESVYRFLNLVSSPRQAALGSKTITLYDYDVNQPLYNPASINEEMDGKLALNYANYIGDVSYGTASYAYTYDKHVNTFHGGITYINYGKFDGRDEEGNATGTFSGSEAALSLGYAYNVPYTKLHLGANAKIISSTLENYQSFGVAADIAASYIDDKNDINYALVVRNFGTQITTYSGTREKLPFEIIAGISQELENVPVRWHITVDNLQKWKVAFSNPARSEETIDGEVVEEKVSFLGNAFRHVIVGAEIMPKRAISFRLSYNFRRAAELKLLEQRTFAGISGGFGIRFGKFRFDYSYSRYSLSANASLFGLMINL